MVKKTIVAVVLVTAVMLAVPFAFAADDSEAATFTDGSSGVGYTLKDASDADMAKLFGPSYKNYAANSILEKIVYNSYLWSISEANVTESEVSEYRGMSIDDGKVKGVGQISTIIKIEFKATCITAGTFVQDEKSSSCILREIGTENTVAVGSTLEVKGEYEIITSTCNTEEYEKNSADNYVLKKISDRNYEKELYSADVTYKYGDGKSLDFVMDSIEEVSEDTTYEYDFLDTKIADVTGDTKCLRKLVSHDGGAKTVRTMECEGKKTGSEMEYDYNDLYKFIEGGTIVPAQVTVYDRSVPDYKFYAPVNALFNTVYDSSLEDNAKLKEFLDGIGSTTESFSDVEDKADSAYSNVCVSKSTNWTRYLLIGAVVILAVAAVAFGVMYFRK